MVYLHLIFTDMCKFKHYHVIFSTTLGLIGMVETSNLTIYYSLAGLEESRFLCQTLD